MAKSSQEKHCKHCGTPFKSQNPEEEYCCHGCEYVARLIHEGGWDHFYDLKRSSIQPVGTRAFQSRDLQWLQDLQEEKERETEGAVEVNFDLQGISCIGCVWLVEKLFNDLPGALRIRIHPQMGFLQLTWQAGEFDLLRFAKEIQQFGYLLGPPSQKQKPSTSGLGLRIGLCGAFVLNAMLFTLPGYLGMSEDFEFAPLFTTLSAIFATLSFLVGGSYFISRAVRSLLRGVLHIDLPIALGLIAAYTGSMTGWILKEHTLVYFDFVAVFTFLMLLGRWIQEAALVRNRNQLLDFSPEHQSVSVFHDDASSRVVPIQDLKQGNEYTVKPGQIIPVASTLISEGAQLSLEWINGESEPVEAQRGSAIHSGAINTGSDLLHLKANEPWEAALLKRLTEGRDDESFRHPLLENILKYYIATVLLLALAGGLGWWWLAGIRSALQVMVSILVVSCPCALGVAVPLADDLASTLLRKVGVFVQKPNLWPRLRKIRQLAFDKTGTLTLETPGILNPESIQSLDEHARSALFHLVETSLHPKSHSIREWLLAKDLVPALPKERQASVKESIGQGVEWTNNADVWRLGKATWACTEQLKQDTNDTVFSLNGNPLADILFEDALRSQAKEEIQALRKEGYGIAILSGDQVGKVEHMVNALGLPAGSGMGGMSPQDKADWIKNISTIPTLMIGDGANDSLAFEEALCRGTPVIDKGMLEKKADFYFLGTSLIGVRRLLHTAHDHRKAYRDVFTFSLTYNSFTVSLCLLGHMNPLLAAILMPLSSIATILLVGLRLGRRR